MAVAAADALAVTDPYLESSVQEPGVPMVAGTDLKKCVTCQFDKPKVEMTVYNKARSAKGVDTYKCKLCNSATKRFRELFSEEEQLGDHFKTFSAEQKNQIIFEAHNKTGSDLKAFVEEQCSVIEATRNKRMNGGVGKFYDDADLKEKYKNKPEDYEAVKLHAYSFVCPIKKKRFYEDIDYVSSNTYTAETEKSRRLSVKAEYEKKKNRIAKPTPPADEENAGGDQAGQRAKPLSEKQVGNLNKILETVQENRETIQKYLKICEAEDIKNMVPSYILNKATVLDAELAVCESTVTLARDENKARAFKEAQSAAKTCKTKSMEVQKIDESDRGCYRRSRKSS